MLNKTHKWLPACELLNWMEIQLSYFSTHRAQTSSKYIHVLVLGWILQSRIYHWWSVFILIIADHISNDSLCWSFKYNWCLCRFVGKWLWNPAKTLMRFDKNKKKMLPYYFVIKTHCNSLVSLYLYLLLCSQSNGCRIHDQHNHDTWPLPWLELW